MFGFWIQVELGGVRFINLISWCYWWKLTCNWTQLDSLIIHVLGVWLIQQVLQNKWISLFNVLLKRYPHKLIETQLYYVLLTVRSISLLSHFFPSFSSHLYHMWETLIYYTFSIIFKKITTKVHTVWNNRHL